MGYELRILMRSPDEFDLDALLRQVPGFEGFDVEHRLYRFRRTSPCGSMPDAWVMLDPGGLYFCDNGAEGSKVLQDLKHMLSSSSMDIEEL